MKRISYIINVLSLLFIVAARAFGVAAAIAIMFLIVAQPAQANDRENFSVGKLTIETDIDSTDGSFTIYDATLVAPAITGGGTYAGASVTASVVQVTYLRVTAQASTTTNTAVLAVIGGDYELSNTDAPSITNTFSATAATNVGNYVRIANLGTNSIVLPESGVVVSAGALTLGQYDSALFKWQNTNILLQIGGIQNN